MKKVFGKATLKLSQGDITELAVDVVVNAANRYLAHSGGVALAIVRKGGPAIQSESTALIAKRGPLSTGDTVITGGGKLRAKFVVHTVGPVWGEQSEKSSDTLLRRAVRNCLTLAGEKGLKSIAFPSISTGIYGFPVERAARLMLSETAECLTDDTSLERIVFCLYDENSYRVFEEAFQGL
jgi:O-acetyl-ADP-ribose deacetylase (regulator of RNase III)